VTGDRIVLRWIETARLAPQTRQALTPLLSSEERARAQRFHFETDRHVYTAAHALKRAVLADIGGRPPESWRFDLGPHGKPTPVVDPGVPPIRLNLSHTAGLAVVAATVGREIGVDAEWLGRPAPMDVAGRYFTPEECAQLTAAPEAYRTETFLAFWTLKEAYIKALGRGLTLPLDSFAFHLDPVRLLYSRQDPDPARWTFHRRRIGDGHICAVAAEASRAAEVPIAAAPAAIDRLLALAAGG